MSNAVTSSSLQLASNEAARHAGSRAKVDLFPYLLILPIIVLMLAVTVYPLIEAVRLAFTDASLLRLQRASFTGLANARRLLDDGLFFESLGRTLKWVLAVVLLELTIALPMALFLHRKFRGRGIVRAIMMIPYITPPAVIGFLFVYMWDGNFGVVNDILVRAGIISEYRSWLSEPEPSFWIVVAAMVWYGTPLLTLIILAALQTIPQELYEAAEVDGASMLTQFRRITLPHILPSILFLCLLRTVWMANHVDMIFVITGGGPGFSNYTAALYSFQLTTQYEIGYASTTAVALALILMAGAFFYVRHLARTVLAGGSA